MNGKQRRETLLQLLQTSELPLSGAELGKLLGVSRQVIVQDIALLRAQTELEIISTHRGYMLLWPRESCTRVFKVRHDASRTEEELLEIVALGGVVEDVFVYHKVYGVVRGALNIQTQADVQRFMEQLRESVSAPLMRITDDYHYHTVKAPTVRQLDLIEARLDELGFLAPLREFEPEELRQK